MLTQEDAVEILVLLKQGMGVREVARRCGVSRNTVRRVRDEGSERRYTRQQRASKLDAFRDYLAERIASAAPKRIPASVLLREIKARGYTGSARSPPSPTRWPTRSAGWASSRSRR
jgi:transposase